MEQHTRARGPATSGQGRPHEGRPGLLAALRGHPGGRLQLCPWDLGYDFQMAVCSAAALRLGLGNYISLTGKHMP